MPIKIKKTKDPWWIVFKIVLFLLLAISLWSAIFYPVPTTPPITQRK